MTVTALSVAPSAVQVADGLRHALAYNVANFLRSLALPKEVEQWSLTTLREKLVKIGPDRPPWPLPRVPARGGGGPRALFAEILRRIDWLRPRSPPLPAMSGDASVSSNPIGELRPRPHNFVTKQARSGFARRKERCGASSVTFMGLRGLPNEPNRDRVARIGGRVA